MTWPSHKIDLSVTEPSPLSRTAAMPPKSRAPPKRSPRGADEESNAPAGAFDKKPEKPEWVPPPDVGRDFGDPPPPRLQFLQLKSLPWEGTKKGHEGHVNILDIRKYRGEDCVKITSGVLETNMRGRPPRPRSAVVLRAELATLNEKPVATQNQKPEAVYLVHCDSTDTTLARGKTLWLHETAIERRPFGVSRDFCALHEPKWINKFGGIPKLFETIAADHERAKLKAEMDAARGPPTPRPRSGDPAAAKRKPPRPSAEAEVPKTRFRRECPPSIRVRYAPQPRHRPAPPLMAFRVQTGEALGDGGPPIAPPPPLTPRGVPPSPRGARARKSVSIRAAAPAAAVGGGGLAGALSQPTAAGSA